MRRWEVAPADMRHLTDLYNRLGFNRMRNDDFVALCIIQLHHDGKGFGGGHARLWLIIVASPYLLGIRKMEIDAAHLALPAAFQFTHPLMRSIEVRHDGHCIDAVGDHIIDGIGFEAGAANRAAIFFRSDMDEKETISKQGQQHPTRFPV